MNTMPFRPEHSLLRVEVPALGSIDTTNVESLFGMWSLFSKTSHALEQGRRLENLSWRLWNRETFCCAPEAGVTTAPAPSQPRCAAKPKAATKDIPLPALSSSLSSASEDEDLETSSTFASTPAVKHLPVARPEIRRSDSTSSRREKHITPIALEKIVISIKETQHLDRTELPMPNPSSRPADLPTASPPQISETQPSRHVSAESTLQHHAPRSQTMESSSSTVDTVDTVDTAQTNGSNETQIVGSEGSSNTAMSTHSIVRGFKAGGAPSSYRSQTHLATQPTPILKTSPQYHQAPQKKKAAMFTIGTSSGEEESSLDSHMAKGSFKSTLSASLQRPTAGRQGSAASKKQTSFQEDIALRRAAESQDSPVFDSEDEEDEISESAIDDDDDSSDWEDSDDQSGPSSVNDKDLFQRVDSRPDLTSRRSLLTTMMHEPDRARALQNAASRSTPAIRHSRRSTPNGPSVAASPEPRAPAQPQPQDSTRSKPIIMTTSNTHPSGQLALSPRTTRRNMLSTELTESLRKNLLWERQHRSTGNLAAMKRRHTAQDMTKLKQKPEPVAMSQEPNTSNRFSNRYFDAGLQEYHAKGW